MLEGESEEVDVFGKRGRALLRNEKDTSRAGCTWGTE